MLAEQSSSRRTKPLAVSPEDRANFASRYPRQIDAHKQRVTQTNMVYLIGIPAHIADEKVLSEYQYCGQYGQITKILVKKNYFNDFASYSAYVTYSTDEAASVAILVRFGLWKGVNNLLFDRSRIYASYGTNKYCAAFIKFGKCRKQDCPFSHKIQEDREIRQEDNKKLFQDQQSFAKSFVIKNYPTMKVQEEVSEAFPTRYQVIQSLIKQGSIKTKPQQKPKEQTQVFQRSNALKDITSARSQYSTDCSPTKTHQSDEYPVETDEIIPRIVRKLQTSRKSILGFTKGQANDIQDITSLLLEALGPQC